MTRRQPASTRRPPDPEASALEAIGLRPGEKVRFRRAGRTAWQKGAACRLERDGSLRVTDTDGAARAIPIALIQVEVRPALRGAPRWEPLADRAARAVQLTLGW